MNIDNGPFKVDAVTLIRYGFLRGIMDRFERRVYNRTRYLRFLPKYLRMKEFTDPVSRAFSVFIHGNVRLDVDRYLTAIKLFEVYEQR